MAPAKPVEPATSLLVLQEGWNVLHSGAGEPTQFATLPLSDSVEAGPLLQAIDGDGVRQILIPVQADFPEDSLSAGVTIKRVEVPSEAGGKIYAAVRCELPRLSDLFDDVVLDMIHAAVNHPDEPVHACITVLDEWRALLRPVRIKPPSATAVGALVAELYYVAEVVSRDDARRLDFWTGREGQRHDLRRGSTALEVKATLSREGRRCAIHGLEQLDPPEGGALYLAWVRLEQVPDGPLSIQALIDRLRNLGVPAQQVYAGLDERGLPPGSAAPELAFELRETRVIQVTDSFPRLSRTSIRNDVPLNGITNVRYDVDLDAVGVTPLGDSEVDSLLHELAGTSSH